MDSGRPPRSSNRKVSNGRRTRAARNYSDDDDDLVPEQPPARVPVAASSPPEVGTSMLSGAGSDRDDESGSDGGYERGRRRGNDVDDEIDDLLSDRDGGDRDMGDEADGGEGDVDGAKTGEGRVWACKWEGCEEVSSTQADLVKHITAEHVGAGRQPYACVWEGCKRFGQKQASRHALLTHMRSHTGEKPYGCTEPGCDRMFTRSDAMNKHVRSVHGTGADKKRPSGVAPPNAAEDDMSSAVRDLAKDPDLEEVVLRVRARDRQRIMPDNEDEDAVLRYVRDRRPGAGKKRRARKKDGSDSDEFDEGASKRYPLERAVDAYMLDETRETEVPVMGRSRWQAKYIMAKAKLMLVDEENKMRRDELVFWQQLYDREMGRHENGRSSGRRDRDRERERERERSHRRERSRSRDPIEDILSDEDLKTEQ